MDADESDLEHVANEAAEYWRIIRRIAGILYIETRGYSDEWKIEEIKQIFREHDVDKMTMWGQK